jgi:hypothetical protein
LQDSLKEYCHDVDRMLGMEYTKAAVKKEDRTPDDERYYRDDYHKEHFELSRQIYLQSAVLEKDVSRVRDSLLRSQIQELIRTRSAMSGLARMKLQPKPWSREEAEAIGKVHQDFRARYGQVFERIGQAIRSPTVRPSRLRRGSPIQLPY